MCSIISIQNKVYQRCHSLHQMIVECFDKDVEWREHIFLMAVWISAITSENVSALWTSWLCTFCCCCWVASVMSDSVWPHRWQPTRLLRPWDSPGKNTGVGCYFLLQYMKVKSENESEVTQLCPTLHDPMDCSLPVSSVHGILQARVLEWGAIAYSAIKNVLLTDTAT